ncbi:MAG: pyridoxal phosphate-dependent aminotransferase [Bacteroidales bacterium]
MPVISNKAQQMPASPIRKLVPFADAAKKRNIKVYHLNIGQPDIASPKVALDAVKNNQLPLVEYSHSAGILSFRKKLVEYYHQNQIEINENQIIVTNGGSEAILFAFMACLNPGDEVIVTEPFYANYNGFAAYAGVITKPIVSKIENGFALPAIEEFEKIITPKTKAILICNPNNPTGYLYSKAELEALAHIVKKHDLFLLADEVYREFCYDNQKYFSVMNLDGIDNNVILLDSVSKRYSACGCRVGTFITKNKDLYAAVMKFAQARLSPPSYGQIFAEAAIDAPKEYFDAVLKEYTKRRDIIVNSINKMEGCLCPNPKGAFYAVARLPIDDADKFCQWLLDDFNIDGKTVMLAPATGFYSTPGSGKNEVRISYVLKEEDLHGAMRCLEAALKVYPGRTL